MPKRRLYAPLLRLWAPPATGVLCSLLGVNRISLVESDIQTPINRRLPKTVERLTIERVDVRLATKTGSRCRSIYKVLR